MNDDERLALREYIDARIALETAKQAGIMTPAEVAKAVAALPPTQGPKGDPGERGAVGERGPQGDRGEKGEPGPRGEAGLAGERGLPGERGMDGAPGAPGERGLIGEKGLDGKDGKDGRDGRDGKDGITERDMDAAVALAVAKILPDLVENAVQARVAKALADHPPMTYAGVWKEGQAYTPGQTATFGGSLWHCDKATESRPGAQNDDWTLAVKRGRDAAR